MEALPWILAHKDLMNVTGAEGVLSDRLARELALLGIHTKQDEMGCLYTSAKNDGVFLTAMMDVPGHILLQKYEDRSILISTLFKPEDLGNSFTALDAAGKQVKVRRDGGPESLYYIKKKNYGIGTPFKVDEEIIEDNGTLQGRSVTRYALLYVLNLFAERKGFNCLFASHGRSNAPMEYNYALREKMNAAIFLAAIELDGEKPFVLIRNGNCFSDPGLVEKAKCAGFIPYLSPEAISKAAACAKAGVRTVTLALPYKLLENGTRSVTKRSIALFTEALSRLA